MTIGELHLTLVLKLLEMYMTETVLEVLDKTYLRYLDTLTLTVKKKSSTSEKEMYLVYMVKRSLIIKTTYI